MSDVGRWRKSFVAKWRDPRYVGLTDSEKVTYEYLQNGPQTNRLGFYVLSIMGGSEDLKTTPDTLRKRVKRVSDTFGWHYDPVTRVFYQPEWWRVNPPENVKVMLGALKDSLEIPVCDLFRAFANNIEALSTVPDKDGNTVRDTFLKGLTERLRLGSRSQEQYQEPFSGTGKQEPSASEKVSEKFPQVLRPENAKDGSDWSRFIPVAKEVFTFTHRDAPIDELIDTFRSFKGMRNVPREDALQAINFVLSELRAAS